VEIERKDVFDFMVVISDNEFHQVSLFADKIGMSIEQAFAEIIAMGLTDCHDVVTGKG